MNKLLYYASRLKQLGFKQGYTRLAHRIFLTSSYYQLKYNLFKQASPTTFTQLCSRFNFKNIQEIKKKLSLTFLDKLFTHPDFVATIPQALKNKQIIIEQADAIVDNKIELFGKQMQFKNWHCDYKKSEFTWPQMFYRDIKITLQKTTSFDDYHPDIKVPWELSRMHQSVILGLAYQQVKTYNIEQANKYVTAFEKQVTDWIINNKYLYGVNWVCPMDCAIRATNLIWTWYLFKNAQMLSNHFLEQLLCSLYDHSRYLEQNWETSPTPNNHYIADLIGFDYLCSFFALIDPTQQFFKKKQQTIQKLKKQFALQILPDGAAYEGSVSYHRLDLEFYLHFYYLNLEQMNTIETNRLEKMLTFAQATNINRKEFIQIGDTDNGKLVFGIELQSSKLNQTQSFNNFGLTIIQQNNWLISHRTSTHASNQPSGHFHEDHNSITLSINQEPIIVDPGSYLYTANSFARNRLRSQAMHNGPQLYKKNGINLERLTSYKLEELDLFQLPQNTNNTHQIERILHFDQTINKLTIQDRYKIKIPSNNLVIAWNFLFSPQTGVEVIQDGWIVQSKTIKLKMQTTFNGQLTQSYYATQYGTLQPCWSLQAEEPAQVNIPYLITIEQIN